MFQIFYLIAIALGILLIIRHLIRRYSSSSDISTAATLARDGIERANHWHASAEALLGSEDSDYPSLFALQTISNSLAFPKFDPIVVEYLHPRVLESYLKKVDERRSMDLQVPNLQIVEKLRERFPRLPASRVDLVCSQVKRAGEFFADFCSADEQAIQSLKKYRNLKEVLTEVEDVRFDVYSRSCQYMKAACEARQSIVRLFLRDEEVSATGTVEDVLRETSSHKVGFTLKMDIDSMKSTYADALKRSGSSDNILVDLVILGVVFDSPRWSYFPVLKGEGFRHLSVLHSTDLALTNYMLVYLLDEKTQFIGVPLARITSAERDSADRQHVSLLLSQNEVLRVPHRGGGLLKALQKQLEHVTKTVMFTESPALENILLAQAKAVVAAAALNEIRQTTQR